MSQSLRPGHASRGAALAYGALSLAFLFSLSFPVEAASLRTVDKNQKTQTTGVRRTRSTQKSAATSTPAVKPAETSRAPEPAASPAPVAKTERFVSKVESVTRQVDVQAEGGSWQKAKRQMDLKTSDQVRTGKSSVARLRLGDGSKVLLLQNSQAEMENLSSLQKTLKLVKGRVRAIVAKIRGGNNFQIKTPVGVASVRGTDFEVEISEDGKEMIVDVNEGQVGVARLGDMAGEVLLNPGERIKFGIEGEMGNPIRSGALPLERQDIRSEVQVGRVKDSIVAQAAEDLRNADYQVGKSLIDVDGRRVRVEEYITRPAANQFKLVVLNERPTRFDYFTYRGTFNTSLPTDLSIALRDVGGKLGDTAPTYYLTAYETLMSNTVDAIKDAAGGGHLVKVDFDGTNYTLTDVGDTTNTRTIEAAALQSDGSYKIYNPVRDTFSTVTASNRDEALKISVLDSNSGSYRNLATNDTLWKTRFNTYAMSVNDVAKTAYDKKTNINNTLAIDLDATFSNAPITTVSEFPGGTSSLYNRLSLYYSDGTKLVYNNYIINDEGEVAPSDAFSGTSNSASYKQELEKWNYEQKVTADEMNGRSIDLVVDPRIGTKSGLIQ